ncbi:MAG: transglycosylase domain-containing protein [Clostridiales bacterium]|nr:transglycosylase domain-containing protein [Clostridiales bacterium]
MKKKRRFLKVLGIVTAVLIITGVAGGVGYVSHVKHSENYVQFDKGRLNEVYTSLTLLDKDGAPLAEPLYLNDYKQIPLDALHDYTYMAFVAVEDKRFFQHNGIDYKRVGGAILHNIKSGGYKEGASTISQQLIKNTHLDNYKTLRRKVNEMLLASELERAYSKREILEMYVNTIYFGRSAYGIETAANVYFNKSAADLTVSESAVLAGMIKAPNNYAPDKNAEKCKARRDRVLKLMLEQGIIDQSAYDEAIASEVTYTPQASSSAKSYTYHVMQEACKILNMTPLQLAKSDFVIETYCNQQTQKELTKLVNSDATATKNGALSQLACVVCDNKGGVEACYMRGEGADAKRQVGSAIKPIAVYAPALNERIITQASPVLDEETDFNGYKPTNAGGYNGWTTIKYAVAKSLNVPAVKTLNALGLPTAEKYLSKFGIDGEQNLSLALGNANGGMDIFTLAKCYATLANDGCVNDVAFIKNIYSEKGLIYSREQDNERVFNTAANYLMTDLLINTVETGTAKLLKNNKFQVAAKTGTVGNSEGNSDALVAGYTTENTFVVWYSGEMNNTINGGTEPCKFAANLLNKMYTDSKPKKFATPNSVIQLDVDKDSLDEQQLVIKCDMGLRFWFDKANQPKDVLKKIVYNYALEIDLKDNTVFVKLPEVENGKWRLYSQAKNERSSNIVIENGLYIGEIQEDTEFYAELYVNNKLVYTTPRSKVCPTDSAKEREEKKNTNFPSLTDFWYWR